MRCDEIILDMRTAGYEPEKLPFLNAFVHALSALSLRPDSTIISLIIGSNNEQEDLFCESTENTIYLNVVFLSNLEPACHIYCEYLMGFLKRKYSAFAVELDFSDINVMLSTQYKPEATISIHRTILLLEFFCKKFGIANSILAKFDAGSIPIDMPPRLYARPGNVELRALRVILNHGDEIDAICHNIMRNWQDERYMYKKSDLPEVDVADHLFAIRELITNAGMYAIDAERLAASLRRWSSLYLSGLLSGHELYLRWDYSAHAHTVRASAWQQGLRYASLPPLKVLGIDHFYSLFSNRNVLLISPFVELCLGSVSTGRIKKIWRDINISEFNLFGVKANITTYPNCPDTCWNATFDSLCTHIDEVVARHKIDLVVGSCGCYGIPAMDYCVKRYSIPSIYYGNYTHMLFGVHMKDFNSVMDKAKLENWVEFKPNDDRIQKSLERIESGRYL